MIANIFNYHYANYKIFVIVVIVAESPSDAKKTGMCIIDKKTRIFFLSIFFPSHGPDRVTFHVLACHLRHTAPGSISPPRYLNLSNIILVWCTCLAITQYVSIG